MKKPFIVISVLLNVVFASGAVYIWYIGKQAQETSGLLQKKLSEINRENKTLIDERRRASLDLEYYKSTAEKLRDEKKSLETEIADVRGKIDLIEDVKEADIQALKLRLKQLKLNFTERQKAVAAQNEQLTQENEQLKDEAKLFEAALKELNSLYHNNMGIAFTRAQLFDKAIEAYEQSIADSPTNAEAFYNLGVLYENVKRDPLKARQYYQRYLALEPDSDDRQQIEQKISSLSGSPE